MSQAQYNWGGAKKRREWLGWVAGGVIFVLLVGWIFGGDNSELWFSASRFSTKETRRGTVFGLGVPGWVRTTTYENEIGKRIGKDGAEDWVLISVRRSGVRGGKTVTLRILNGSFFREEHEARWVAYLEKDEAKARATLMRVGKALEASVRKGPMEVQARVLEAIKDDGEAIKCFGEDEFEMTKLIGEEWWRVEGKMERGKPESEFEPDERDLGTRSTR